jgi:peptidoglycan/xylan/chitin deacetylase (PgdA/CDA1 family)
MKRYDYLKVNFLKKLVPVFGPVFRTCGNLRVLSYHSIEDHSAVIYNTTSSDFKQQIRFLIDHSYRFISADHLLNCTACDPGEKYVLLTFDDGYLNNYDIATSFLHTLNIPAIFFINTAYLDDEKNNPVPNENSSYYPPDLKLMSWRQVCELSKHGFTIGSHSHTHRMVTKLSDDELAAEIRNSVEMITARIGVPASTFSYPYGTKESFSGRTSRILEENNIRMAFTEQWGSVKMQNIGDLFTLNRVPILGYDTLKDFNDKVKGHYDFLRFIS